MPDFGDLLGLHNCCNPKMFGIPETWDGDVKSMFTHIQVPPFYRVCAIAHDHFIDKNLLDEWQIQVSERTLSIFEDAFPNDSAPRDCLNLKRENIGKNAAHEILRAERFVKKIY